VLQFLVSFHLLIGIHILIKIALPLDRGSDISGLGVYDKMSLLPCLAGNIGSVDN